MTKKNREYDLAVIGGGPAGMMAAGRAASKGSKVILLEKNRKLGVKLLLTGKGRCNLAHQDNQPRDFIKKFGPQGNFLFSALHQFGLTEIINFFEEKGLLLKTERGGRIFPKSDSAQNVCRILFKYLNKSGVEIKTNSPVKKIIIKKKRIEKIILKNGREIKACNFLIATGGKSYPQTGSTGDGYFWLKKMGHQINKLRPALTPLICTETFLPQLEGLSLKNVEVSLYQKKKKIDSRFGEALFTQKGMSGPIILDLSSRIGQELEKKLNLYLSIDFKPALSFPQLDQRIQRDFNKKNNRFFKNSLDDLFPQKLIPVILQLSQIPLSKKVHSLTKKERKIILHLCKEFKLKIKKLDGYQKAIITAGGVDLKEVNPLNMQSKIIDNLYLAGEILDLNGPTGGYNLQICWTTGWVAGNSLKLDKKENK
jgi:hypothetical protein